MKLLILFCVATALNASAHDVVIYGGTSAGVIAAVQTKIMGKSVVIVCPDKHLGGLSSGGLGWTDTGEKAVIGGLAREFYHRIWLHYQKPEAWRWQKREEYGNRGQGTPAIDGERRTMWIFEPHVAEQVFENLIREHHIPVHRNEWLDRTGGVKKKGARITAIRTLSGKTYEGKIFIDATYEGDLMAAAGVDYHVGRESQSHYGEKWAGVQTGVLHHRHHFGVLKEKISPYRIPGDPSSGVLPRISTEPPGQYGSADHRVQAYCFRMCLTDHPDNRIPFPKPEGYDPDQYELLLRIFNAGWRETFHKFDPIPNRKTDTNNHGPFSTDNIGYNYDYPDASYERRREIIREHETYQKGLMYFIANDPRVPEDVQKEMRRWGLARDEFTDNGHWPHQLYIREARRMIGKYVMTEHELLKRRPTPQPVGMGSYTIDSHNVQRYITPEGHVQNEGDIGVPTKGPYAIAYGALVPKPGQCDNLLVPVCVSASHVAYGSIRMEPVFMILAQSAATAACIAIDDNVPVQDVSYEKLRARLLADKQVLEWTKGLTGLVMDCHQAKLTGQWQSSGQYLHDQNPAKGEKTARFELKVPADGLYEVRLAYVAHPNRATNVPVTIESADGTTTVRVNQRQPPLLQGRTVLLGKFRFAPDKPAIVTISNAGTDGYVIADAVQLLPAN
ncbi:MAG: FAD-dependent oxidoreductase [Verrucomicrobiae bacterium]|nr:FAD-dependent oxidoreductase [Verrucomicrobiae bacterium]